jgi:hypothetical protein
MDTVKTNSNGHGTNGHRAMRARPRDDSRSTRRRGTSQLERRGIVAVCVVAGVVAAFAPSQPTVLPAVNAVLNGLFGAAVTWACSRARRWTWLVLTGVVVLLAQDVWLVLGVIALGVALAASFVSRHRIYGAVVGALAVQGLLHLPEVSFPLGSALVVAATLTPVFASAYMLSPRRVRRRVHWAIAGIAIAYLIGGVIAAIAVGTAYRPAIKAVDSAESGLNQVQQGSNTRAAELLGDASKQFGESNDAVTAPWASVALAVPIISQHMHAVDEVTAQGSAVTASAASTAALVDYDELRYVGGRVDVDKLSALQAPVRKTAAAFDTAQQAVHAARSPWLLGPLNDRIDDFQEKLDEATPQADLAARAIDAVPGLLGADGVRHYFIGFVTPSELRGSGGLMGNWAELTADHGSLRLTRSGRAQDLNDTPGRSSRAVTQPADYVSRYTRFQPGFFVQDVTLSPDMPSVGQAMKELFPEMGGDHIDGMLAVDPYGLASLLALTGPIDIDGYDQKLTKDNAADLLISQQYFQFGDNAQRKDFLDDAGHRTFEKLVRSDLPSPRKLGEIVGPMVQQHRIKFTSLTDDPTAHDREQSLIETLGADGAFPPKGDGDFFSLITQNKGENKIDIYMHRKVQYSASYDPDTGEVTSHATVTIRNDAPPAGLPGAIIGNNDQGFPLGTNELFFSFYTPLGLRDATIDGQATPMEYQLEFGYSVYSRFITIPSGATVTVDLDLFGRLKPGNQYSLGISPQSTVNPDEVVATVDVPSQWSITGVHHTGKDGFSVDGNGSKAVLSASPRETFLSQLDLSER